VWPVCPLAGWPVGRCVKSAFDLFEEVNNSIFLFRRFTLEPKSYTWHLFALMDLSRSVVSGLHYPHPFKTG